MDRDTAARALADAYTAARAEHGMTAAPGVAMDTGRFIEQWLLDHGFRVVEGMTLTAVPGQEIPPGGGPIEWTRGTSTMDDQSIPDQPYVRTEDLDRAIRAARQRGDDESARLLDLAAREINRLLMLTDHDN